MTRLQKYTIYIPHILIALALACLAVWAGHLGWHTYQLWRLRFEAEQISQKGLDVLEPAQAQDLVHRLDSHLSAIDSDLGVVYPLLWIASKMPVTGKYAGQVQPLVQYAHSLAQAGDGLLTIMAPLWLHDSPAESAETTPQRLFAAVQAGGAQIDAASLALDEASQARRQIDLKLLPGRASSLLAQVDRSFPLLQAGVSLLSTAPTLMGAEQPATYLVLAQNADELRATGGFISGIGIIHLYQGDIVDFQVSDSYAVDDQSMPYPPPPEPIQRLMLAGYWVPRDANWSPDFPTAAQQAQSLYEISTGLQTQGVIAFDQEAIRGVLAALGPVSLPDVPEPVSAENVDTFMRQSWEPGSQSNISMEWWRGRKDFMGILGKAILASILHSGNPKSFLSLGKAALDLIESGHVLVYFNSPQAQASLEKAGLAHSLRIAGADYLMVVDSNVGFNKADALIRREVDYSIDLRDPENPSAQLVLKYSHSGQPGVACIHGPNYGSGAYTDLEERCYWDYWRVYLPEGSELYGSQVEPVPGEELLGGKAWPGVVETYPGENGTRVFAGVMVLPTGADEELRLNFRLSGVGLARDPTGKWRYRLQFKKQPGIESRQLKLEVRLSDNYTLEPETSGWESAPDSTWVWSKTVDRDQEFEINIAPLSDNAP